MIRHRSALLAPVRHLPLGVRSVIQWNITVQQTPAKVVLLAGVKEGSQCCFWRICSSFFKVGLCEEDSVRLLDEHSNIELLDICDGWRSRISSRQLHCWRCVTSTLIPIHLIPSVSLLTLLCRRLNFNHCFIAAFVCRYI
jgi:hypothetical protein